MGCMALLKSALPIRSAPANGTRGVLQLCYSLVSPRSYGTICSFVSMQG